MSDETLDNIEIALEEDVKPEPEVLPVAEESKEAEEVKVEDVKVEEPAAEPVNVVEAPKPTKVAGLAPVENGAIGSTKVDKTPKPEKVATKATASDKVAVFSDKNVSWSGVGNVYRGINIVSKEASEKWLERSHIRLATPEEVAKEFGL